MPSATLEIVTRPSSEQLEAALALRHRVFVEEQNVDESLERDHFDVLGAGAQHVVALVDGAAVGTGRVRRVDTGVAKVERVAVDRRCRGMGIGKAVMAALEAQAREVLAADTVKLAAQHSAVPFYRRLDYRIFGDAFIEAGILHRWMRRPLDR